MPSLSEFPFWDHYFRTSLIMNDGVELPRHPRLNFLNAAIVENHALNRIDIDLGAGATPGGATGETQVNVAGALAGVAWGVPIEAFAGASDNAKLVAALATIPGTNGSLELGGKAYTLTGIDPVPMGATIAGRGPNTVLQTTSNAQVLLVRDTDAGDRAKYTCFRDFRVLGNSTGGNQNAIEVGYLGVDGTSQLIIARVIAQNMGGRGITFVSGDEIIGPSLVQCEVANCGDGYYAAHQGTMTGCKARDCDRGLVVASGNVNFTGGQIIECTIGVEVLGGGNDAHGIVANTHINHCGTAVKIGSLTNAMQFSDCHIYDGALEVNGDGSNGLVHFDGGEFDFTALDIDGGGVIFRNCTFDEAYFASCTESNNGWVEFINPRPRVGNLPSWIVERIYRPYFFASNANQNLTAQDSVAKVLLVGDGTINVTRKLTNYFGPAAGREQRVCNFNAEDIEYAFASGLEVTIPTMTWADIIGLEGKAAIIAAGTLTGAGPTPPTPPFDPASLTLSFWVRASYGGSGWSGVASAGASGSRNLATLTNAPDIGASLNGLAGADCDGVNEAFDYTGGTLNTILSNAAYTYVWAGVPRSPAAAASPAYNGDLLVGDNGGTVGTEFSASGVKAFHDDGTLKTTAAVACSANNFHTIAVRYNGTNLQIRVDGGAWTSVAAGNVGAGLSTVVLRLMRNFASVYADGVIYEFMAAQSALSDGTIDDIEAYLVDRYQ